jgi:hypothetical protein
MSTPRPSGTQDTLPVPPTISRRREEVSWSCSLAGLSRDRDATSDTHGARAAHRILDKIEVDDIARLEVVDGRALLYVGAMEEHLAVCAHSDEPGPLSDG